MKRICFVIPFLLLLSGCLDKTENPYSSDLNVLTVEAIYPDGYESFMRAGVVVAVENIATGHVYNAATDDSGKASLEVVNGLYRISISDRVENNIFNASTDKLNVVGSDVSVKLTMMQSKAGSIVIKEIYSGGCKKLPLEGNYQSDKYIILHNNDNIVRYLDGLCVGTVSPYNSNASNPWISKNPETGETVYPDFLPVIQAIWQFSGSGESFPLQPGGDAVVALNGAIDHTVQYPLSVNLNKPDYFVCYNNTYFPNVTYHPAPGDMISMDRILDVVIKTGQANAYTISMSSPVILLFEAKETTIQEFVRGENNVIPVPGSKVDNVVKIPPQWVLDAVEVFDGRSASNVKRLMPSLDAGYVLLSDIYLGHTLMRKTDEEASAKAGFEVLADTNNSGNDFYERERQSLHE